MYRIFFICFFVLFSAFSSQARHKHLERWYQEQFCHGQTEVKLEDGTRVDCLTDHYAVEFDFAPKWAEAIGQSLHYADITKKKPAIVLIIEQKQHIKHMLKIANLCNKLRIRLFFILNIY